MKKWSLVLLAAGLAFAVYGYSSKRGSSNTEVILKVDEPVEDVDQCLRVYGKKVQPDFNRTSAGEDVGGIRVARTQGPSGATYQSTQGELRVTLRNTGKQYDLEIRSTGRLKAEELAIFRWCAQQGSRIPADWNDVTGPRR